MELELLFSYGTLAMEKVQLASFGRILKGTADQLVGFELKHIRITNPDVLDKSNQQYHPIALETGKKSDIVEGTIFEITPEELKQADHYEVADYKRIKRTFTSGREAWIYVRA